MLVLTKKKVGCRGPSRCKVTRGNFTSLGEKKPISPSQCFLSKYLCKTAGVRTGEVIDRSFISWTLSWWFPRLFCWIGGNFVLNFYFIIILFQNFAGINFSERSITFLKKVAKISLARREKIIVFILTIFLFLWSMLREWPQK